MASDNKAKPCPRCNNQGLSVSDYHGEEVDFCRACGGLWFEHGELNRMIAEVNDGPTGERYRHNFGKFLGPGELDCPGCLGGMDRFHLLEHYHAEIDICRSCDGSWIDQDELYGVKSSPELQGILAELNKGISWKTYIFQLLSQMPVEYNIKPKLTPWVNWSLILLNVVIFMAYFFDAQSSQWTMQNLAMTPAEVSSGQELWTLLSCVFLHGGFMHIIGNMYFLYIIGDNLEDVLGHKKYLFYYLLCGIAASLASMLFRFGSDIPSVGASGAIAGLFGMYLMWFRHSSLTFMFIIYQKKLSAFWFFLIWLGINIWGLLQAGGGVDYGAHLGGFFVGLIIGYVLKDKVLAANPMINLLNQREVKIKR